MQNFKIFCCPNFIIINFIIIGEIKINKNKSIKVVWIIYKNKICNIFKWIIFIHYKIMIMHLKL